MSYYAFNNLHSILKDNLKVNDNMARVSNMECNTESITTESRLACFLIVLGGGRVVEAMRTHGVSRTFVYNNFNRILDIIINHPQLKISCSNHIDALKERLFIIQYTIYKYYIDIELMVLNRNHNIRYYSIVQEQLMELQFKLKYHPEHIAVIKWIIILVTKTQQII